MNRRKFVRRVQACLFAGGVSRATGKAGERLRPSSPCAVARDSARLLVADTREPGIFACGHDGHWALTVPGGANLRTPLHAVTALAVDGDGTLFATDRATGEVYRIERGKPPTPLSGRAFEIPTGLAVDSSGKLVVCDLRLGIVARLPRAGGPPETFARVPAPRAVAVGPGAQCVVLSMGPDQLVLVNADGTSRPLVRGTPFRFPLALLRDEKSARWLVSDGYAHTIWEVDDKGKVRAWVRGDPLVRPSGLCTDESGAVLVADPGAGKIFRVAGQGNVQPAPCSR